MKVEKVSVCISVKEPTDTENYNMKEHKVDDMSPSISQKDLEKVMKTSGLEPESRSESRQPQDGQTEGSVCPSLIKAEKVESLFKFDLGGFELGSLPSPVNRIRQTASEASIQFSSSGFDFSAMQTEISKITLESKAVTLETATTQKVNDRNSFMKEKAQHLQQMPLTESNLHRILPVAALDRLIESSGTCVSLTKLGKRCRIKLREPTDEAPDIFDGLSSLDARKDWDAIYPKLIRIVEISLCRHPHRRMAMEELLALNGRMIEWANERDSGTVETFKDPICRDSDVKIVKLRERLVQRAKAEHENVSQNAPSETTDESTIAATIEPFEAAQQTTLDRLPEEIERIQYIQTFLPYQPHGFSSLSLQLAIRKVLEAPLAYPELDSKYLYIYWSPGNFGYVKIGVTDNVPNRLRGWEDQCKHDVREHLQQASGERRVVKHAYRVEKLVHTELKEVRFQEINCKGCGGTHIEWFRTSPEHAAKVIKKYSDWTAANPYQFDKLSNRWRLNKKIGKSNIAELCEPIVLQSPKISVGSTRRMVPRRRSSTQMQSPSRYSSPG
ncbi:DUF1766-domain-containing protein [Zopfia rhizophila CBS 207.26]|uniref:DUF1766-domain-containing protein n=1 Tax=Zopfia rhizophila CBS 207.26 TaxID=1314779 RepID=A0A6A6EG59_9PEZI|nr:DUF1766-domain-containing protein [Zopfia rhizophila CBS 207.26]